MAAVNLVIQASVVMNYNLFHNNSCLGDVLFFPSFI